MKDLLESEDLRVTDGSGTMRRDKRKEREMKQEMKEKKKQLEKFGLVGMSVNDQARKDPKAWGTTHKVAVYRCEVAVPGLKNRTWVHYYQDRQQEAKKKKFRYKATFHSSLLLVCVLGLVLFAHAVAASSGDGSGSGGGDAFGFCLLS